MNNYYDAEKHKVLIKVATLILTKLLFGYLIKRLVNFNTFGGWETK